MERSAGGEMEMEMERPVGDDMDMEMGERFVLFPGLEGVVERIVTSINSLNILNGQIIYKFIPRGENIRMRNGIDIIINDNDGVKVGSGTFFIYQKGDEQWSNTAHIQYIGTSLSKSCLGSFIFLIIIMILLPLNVISIDLDNYADVPWTAAKGIYKYMDWNTKGLSGEDLKRFKASSDEEKFKIVEGEMIKILTSGSHEELKILLLTFVEKLMTIEHGIWQTGNKPNILKIYDRVGGMKKRRRIRKNKSKRKSNQKNKSKRRSNQKNKSKRRNKRKRMSKRCKS